MHPGSSMSSSLAISRDHCENLAGDSRLELRKSDRRTYVVSERTPVLLFSLSTIKKSQQYNWNKMSLSWSQFLGGAGWQMLALVGTIIAYMTVRMIGLYMSA